MEMITGEQLEQASGFHSSMETCYECGGDVDTDEWYGVSRDGERFCCFDCLSNVTLLGGRQIDNKWMAWARHGDIEVCVTKCKSREQAFLLAEQYGEMTNEGVNSYVEVG